MRLPIALLMLIIFSLSTAQSQNDYWFQRTLEGSSVMNPSESGAMAYHKAKDEVVLVAGSDDWYRDSISWQKGTNNPGIGNSENAVMAYDCDRKKVVLYGVGKQYNQKTMWNVLYENGKDLPSDWMIYYSQGTFIEDETGTEDYAYVRDLMHQLQDKKFDKHFDTMETFFSKAKAGTLPSVSFLEPKWGLEKEILGSDIGINGTDYHPPGDVTDSEKFLKKIYDALTSNEETWSETLWIINFDEHGGTYDHVAPPWGATPPWSSDGTPKPEEFELDFQFDRFGVRVPLILVSPLVQESTVFRAEGDTPYDHTSVIATILNMMGIPKDKWGLGGRTANAPTFENVFTGNDLRKDIPPISINTKGISKPNIAETTPPNDIQLSMSESLLSKAIRKKGLSKEHVEGLSLPSIRKSTAISDLHIALTTSLNKIDAKE